MKDFARWNVTPLVLTVVYLVFGFTLLLFSDVVLTYLVDEPLLTSLQGLKGFLEVGITGLFIYVLTRFTWEELFVKQRMIDEASVGITTTDFGGEGNPILYSNAEFESMTGYRREEFEGQDHSQLWDAEATPDAVETFRDACNEGRSTSVELECRRRDGSTFTDAVEVSPVYRGGSLKQIVVFHRDVTRRKKFERQLRDSLDEKDTLLREVHHRVKNNMQILLGLLGLQIRDVDDDAAAEALRESKQRIHSMALIHEKLYDSDQLSQIDFSEYVDSLVDEIIRVQNYAGETISVETRVEPVNPAPGMIVNCGLIINELVTNSLQHGLSDSGSGRITVRFTRTDSGYRLVVSDNGSGIDPGLMEENSSLGMKLVRRLVVDQLDGQLTIGSDDGTTTIITLPLP